VSTKFSYPLRWHVNYKPVFLGDTLVGHLHRYRHGKGFRFNVHSPYCEFVENGHRSQENALAALQAWRDKTFPNASRPTPHATTESTR
jgi:hypothetical protein